MAALTASGVTINDWWSEGGTNGRKFKAKEVNLVLSSQGGASNTIAASLFGMTKIVQARSFRDSSSNSVIGFPSYDGTKLYFCTAETAGTPADQTATLRGVVVGK
jgi:hypothetical protein